MQVLHMAVQLVLWYCHWEKMCLWQWQARGDNMHCRRDVHDVHVRPAHTDDDTSTVDRSAT